MNEIIDTRGDNKDIPDGEYDFKVVHIRKLEKNGNRFYAFEIETDGNRYEQVFFPNKMGELLKVLGCTETLPGQFSWDPDLMEGKTFHASVKHEADKKGIIRQQMAGFKEVKDESIPF